MTTLLEAQDVLRSYTDRDLIALGVRLGKGTFGRDPARLSKAAKIAYLIETYDLPDIDAALAAAGPGPITTAPKEGAPIMQPTQPIPMDFATAQPAHGNGADPHARGNGAAPKGDDFDALMQLAQGIRALTAGTVSSASAPLDEERVRLLATEEAAQYTRVTDQRLDSVSAHVHALEGAIDDLRVKATGMAPVVLSFPGINAPAVSTEGRHPVFGLVMALAALPHEYRPNILLVGPAGCGKSTLAQHVAQGFGVPFSSVSLSAGVTEAALTCRVLPIGEGGRFGSVDSEFLTNYGRASVILLDEFDAADPNVILVANAALANGGFHVEARAVDGRPTYVPRDPRNVILAAANTYGYGATSQYVGRGALDAATLDRFVTIEMGYDAVLEASIMGAATGAREPWAPDASLDEASVLADLRALHAWVTAARTVLAQSGAKRILSTRALQKARALRMVGCSVAVTIEMLTAGWSDDERALVRAISPQTVTREAVCATAPQQPALGVSCPVCSSPMVQRTATKGRNAGKPFYGCSTYPKCTGVREMSA